MANYYRLEYKQSTRLLYLYGDVNKVTGKGLASYPYRSEGDSTQDSFDLHLRGEYNLFQRENEFVIGALYSEQNADTVNYAALDYPPVGNFFEWTGAYPQPAWSDTGEMIPGTIEEAYRAVNGTKIEGFEFEAVGALSPSWQVSFGYTQFKAEDADGIDINTHHPRNLLKLFTSYQFSGALQGLTVGGGVNWQGKTYSNIVNPDTGEDARLVQDDYALFNLMTRYRFNEHLSTQLNVENAFDETYYSQVGFFDQYRYGMPMNYSWHLNYRF
tara:strand:- start:57404 stop:58216 length:813 start_codon:yes stop_codon:yes gene_type:complete